MNTMGTDNTMSRRKALGSMGAVLATTAISPVMAEGLKADDYTSAMPLETRQRNMSGLLLKNKHSLGQA